MERIRKQKSISKIFAIYVILFCIVALILGVASIRLFLSSFDSGVILPANYYEKKIEKQRSKIEKVKDVENLIPKECDYVVYDYKGKVIQGNVPKNKALEMWDIVKSNKTSQGKYFYKIIQRHNEICVVEYTIKVTFANPTLRKYIKNVEDSSIILLFSLYIVEILIFSKYFKKRLEKEMKNLKDTTENIKMGNLDFKVKYSNILEINDVISSLDKMKSELNKSLTRQWNMEETRKEQIGALAHDIKTPLTIIKGNSELLDESNLDSKQIEFNSSILNEIKNMEFYIKSLIEITKSETQALIEKEQIDLMKFIEDIVKFGVSMSINNQSTFKSEMKNITEFIFVDKIALKRAIINVISNAVDYCGTKGTILLTVDCSDKSIQFIVEDSGKGFTKEELSFATEQFFQGDKSRNSKNHYGMGLYISKKLIEKHNGNIILQNSKTFGGAKVILEVPV
ncbi:sensor histidine kinase [Clostridium botulinum]|uniref:sensor histidine kinase n=1 Tax=Clostridium botulinum TaxID=1491 RepID=UPI0004D3F61A|nr:HAMP domain-containing sensor histidine kinase [Clostridium botulinum]KEI04180.1 lantibiotic biosynthesis protein [Clostridium botulinum C/D str. BKT75002]KEI11545.1 lantibiotic biosynthesis protein [Clostridium botulinum C/D str. BKT2873]MCD3351418.1 HAMP domain-containing histidine kinase [Clostridium botulinum D/C]MCD3360374.1 HAMP domain-containing histidine kinase [Clostridium botulinum D/C]MCD3361883.1 HAMP domain-containing histidine kinase [Clostridium botulinum D/C]